MRFYYNKPIDSLKKKRMPKRGENVIGWFLRVDKKLRNIETMSANSSFLYRVSLGSSWVSMGCLFTNNKWRGKQKSERRRRGGEEEKKKRKNSIGGPFSAAAEKRPTTTVHLVSGRPNSMAKCGHGASALLFFSYPCTLLGFRESYRFLWVILGFTEFQRVALDFTELSVFVSNTN